MTEYLIAKLIDYSQTRFSCGSDSIHGLCHWTHVDDSAMLICKETQADLTVVRYFAYLHDVCRLDDGADLEHGARSADALAELPHELSVLTPEQIALLDYSIRHHTDGYVSDDPTIGACWDSDRLDLGRVGMIPSEEYMSTEVGKSIARMGSKYLYIEASGIE